MLPSLYFMVGISGSGKSTIAGDLSNALNIKVISSDAIRYEIYGDENIQDNPQRIFNILHKRVKEELKNGRSVIYDATNLSMKRRVAFLKETKNIYCEKICIIVNTPFSECVLRNELRERTVPYDVLIRQRNSFQCPYFYEGWDKILITNTDMGNLSVLEDTLRYLVSVEHNNPHHTLTIGEHMIKAKDYCIKKSAKYSALVSKKTRSMEEVEQLQKEADQWSEIAFAALYHDIGKAITKTFYDKKGKPTEEAHYYNHQNVSAYMILSNLSYSSKVFGDAALDIEDNISYWLKITVLVQWHMEYYLRKGKAWEKFANLIGEELVELLDKLHEADKAAH